MKPRRQHLPSRQSSAKYGQRWVGGGGWHWFLRSQVSRGSEGHLHPVQTQPVHCSAEAGLDAISRRRAAAATEAVLMVVWPKLGR